MSWEIMKLPLPGRDAKDKQMPKTLVAFNLNSGRADGMQVTPRANNKDGLLDVILVRDGTVMDLVSLTTPACSERLP